MIVQLVSFFKLGSKIEDDPRSAKVAVYIVSVAAIDKAMFAAKGTPIGNVYHGGRVWVSRALCLVHCFSSLFDL
jgi:hypothetical protein